ncbi:hypothetical protein [Lentilactobacillus sp. Marseille-Q4993]|uniref:hypothetical protein n=1 Tax=Lentilactobacillus sp. Marseille-Q4993 TaxID=3039492 RepID=UPI0024BC38FF|nr:hypothetical protein [Lentilactobacillus sp. Marseille-Q4993]
MRIKNLLFLVLSLCIMLFGYSKIVNADTADTIDFQGHVVIQNEARMLTTALSDDDMASLHKLTMQENSRYSTHVDGNYTILDEKLADSGAVVTSSVGSTNTSNDKFTLKVDKNNPVIFFKNKLGNVLQSVKLTQEQLQSKQGDFTVTLDLMHLLDNMEANGSNMNSGQNSGGSNPIYQELKIGQQNGHKYKKGVRVQCNDFNGYYNFSHKYYSRRAGAMSAAKAALNFQGSDCNHNDVIYGCEMSGNSKCKGLTSNKNCSAFKGGLPHMNWSHRLWWRVP